jgi:hypothetical protein
MNPSKLTRHIIWPSAHEHDINYRARTTESNLNIIESEKDGLGSCLFHLGSLEEAVPQCATYHEFYNTPAILKTGDEMLM